MLDRLVGDLVDEIRAPVPLVALRVERVERALEHRVRHRLHAVHQRLGDARPSAAPSPLRPPPRGRRSTTRSRTPRAGGSPPGTAARVAPCERRRTRSARAERAGRNSRYADSTSAPSSTGQKVGPPKIGPDLVQPEQERGDDAEVAAASAERPEQVRVLVGARADRSRRWRARPRPRAGCRSSARTCGSGGRVPPPSVSPPTPVVEMIPLGRGEAVLAGGGVDLAPGAAAADANRARLRDRPAIVLERRQVDHDPVVDRSRDRRRCDRRRGSRAAARGRGRSRRPRRRRRRSAHGRSARAAVDHRVEDGARLLVVGVAAGRSAGP